MRSEPKVDTAIQCQIKYFFLRKIFGNFRLNRNVWTNGIQYLFTCLKVAPFQCNSKVFTLFITPVRKKCIRKCDFIIFYKIAENNDFHAFRFSAFIDGGNMVFTVNIHYKTRAIKKEIRQFFFFCFGAFQIYCNEFALFGEFICNFRTGGCLKHGKIRAVFKRFKRLFRKNILLFHRAFESFKIRDLVFPRA